MGKDTRTIRDLEIFAAGTWNGDTYDVQDLRDIISAAQHVGFEPPLKLGHMEDDDTQSLLKKEGLPSFGWIKNLRIKGTKLIADITDIPKKLAELIDRKAYRRVSAEIFWNFRKGADTYRRVLKAVSLLGAEIPAITDLTGIEALYARIGPTKAYDEQGNEYRKYLYPEMAAPAYELKEKETVKYRLAEGTMERCGSCRFYQGSTEALAVGRCNLVEGEIAADAVCDLYEAREAYQFPGGAGAIGGESDLAFCPTGEGGGIDPSCSPSGGGGIRVVGNGAKVKQRAEVRSQLNDVEDRISGLRKRAVRAKSRSETIMIERDIARLEKDRSRLRSQIYTVEQRGDEWCVLDDDGEIVKCYPTEEEAKEKELSMFQKMRRRRGYVVEQRGDEWCVLDADGEVVECYPSEEEAKAKETALRKKPYIIEERDGEWCLLTADGSRVLGCHPTKEDAEEQERAVQANTSVTILTREQVRKLCAPCAKRMEHANIKALKLSYADLSPNIFQGDPDAICGALWFHGTPEQREGFGEGTEGREADEKPPAAWWDDCVEKVAKASLIGSGIHTTMARRGQGNGDMTPEQKVRDLEGKISRLTQDNAELKSANDRLKRENEDAKNYSQMLLDQKNEIETLRNQLTDVQRAQKEEKIKTFLEEQIRAGKVLPREKAGLLAQLREASEEVKVAYSENGKEVKLSQQQLIEQNIKNRPKLVDFGERSVSVMASEEDGGEPIEGGDVRVEVHEKVKKFQAEHNEPDYKKAQERVLAADPKLKDRYAESSGWSRKQQ